MPGREAHLSLEDNSTGRGLGLVTLSLLALGVVVVHSAAASLGQPGPWYARVDIRHMVFAATAAGVVLLAWRVDYRLLARGEKFPVVAAVVLGVGIVCCLLVFVPGLGRAVGGKHRWIRIGPGGFGIGFQPSELLKIALVVFLSAWLSREIVNVRSFRRTFLPAVAIIGVCAGLVVKQDFGTAVILAGSACVTLLLAGVPWYYLATLTAPAAAAGYWFVVRDPHRWGRIGAMVSPWSSANPSAYQSGQSLLAIATGGWSGKGLGYGTRKLGFLPEDTTDFVFSILCEEMGLVGAIALIGLIVVWIWHARRAVRTAGDGFGRLLTGSLAFLIAVQAAMHIAVGQVLLPPTGVSLPFISAGGTALLCMAGATAMMISVTAHRPERVESLEFCSRT